MSYYQRSELLWQKHSPSVQWGVIIFKGAFLFLCADASSAAKPDPFFWVQPNFEPNQAVTVPDWVPKKDRANFKSVACL